MFPQCTQSFAWIRQSGRLIKDASISFDCFIFQRNYSHRPGSRLCRKVDFKVSIETLGLYTRITLLQFRFGKLAVISRGILLHALRCAFRSLRIPWNGMREHRCANIDAQTGSVFISVKRFCILKYVEICPHSTRGSVIFRRGRIWGRKTSTLGRGARGEEKSRISRNQCDIRERSSSSLWDQVHLALVRAPRDEVATPRFPSTSGGQRGETLLCASPSLFLSPFLYETLRFARILQSGEDGVNRITRP